MAGRLIKHGLRHAPGLKRLPMLKMLAIAEIALLTHDHMTRLEPRERRRLVELVRKSRGRRKALPEDERVELTALVAKVEPRRFAGMAADKVSPVPLPRRLVHGKERR